MRVIARMGQPVKRCVVLTVGWGWFNRRPRGRKDAR